MRRLPVIDVDKIVGIITEKDIAHYCVFAFTQTIKTLEEIDPEAAKEFEQFEDERYKLVAKDK
jgi:CBS domain-containing protein